MGLFRPRVTVWALAIYLVDAFFLNQGVVAGLTAVAVALYSLITWFRGREEAGQTLFRVAVMSGMAVAVFLTNTLNNQMAHRRAEALILACQQYEARHHEWPAHLSDLVPEFIPEVPIAKYTLNMNTFYYISRPSDHALLYVEVPPFGRPTYDFEAGRWGYLD